MRPQKSYAAIIARTLYAGLWGGLASVAAGGKFKDGAFQAAMVHMFNAEYDKIMFNMRYGAILRAGDIDIDKNIADAGKLGKSLDLFGFEKLVKGGGDWDYKGNKDLKYIFSTSLLAEFGNVHFGIVANAFGFNLETSMYGAGFNEVFRQNGGSKLGLAYASMLMGNTRAGYGLPDFISRGITNLGFSWGDNPDSARNIMHGWDYYDKNY